MSGKCEQDFVEEVLKHYSEKESVSMHEIYANQDFCPYCKMNMDCFDFYPWLKSGRKTILSIEKMKSSIE